MNKKQNIPKFGGFVLWGTPQMDLQSLEFLICLKYMDEILRMGRYEHKAKHNKVWGWNVGRPPQTGLQIFDLLIHLR